MAKQGRSLNVEERPYRMRRRAENVGETRRRIVDAAVRLHTTIGPAHTSIAGVAQKAGVTRLTVYRHFPDLHSLYVACGSHWESLHPSPTGDAWRAEPDLRRRAARAFGEMYAWFRANRDELEPLERDREATPPSIRAAITAEARYRVDALLASNGGDEATKRRVRAVAGHFLDFRTWQSVTEWGLTDGEAAELATHAVAHGAMAKPSL